MLGTKKDKKEKTAAKRTDKFPTITYKENGITVMREVDPLTGKPFGPNLNAPIVDGEGQTTIMCIGNGD